jgi:cytosine/creatinine deaminase
MSNEKAIAGESILLRGGRPWGTAGVADILVCDGRIARIEPDIQQPAAEIVEIPNLLVIPGLVEAHCHLDKTLFGGDWVPHSAGDTLGDRIANERQRRHEVGVPDVDRITSLLERMIISGTTHVRTHTDIDPSLGLSGVEAVNEAAARVGDRIAVQQVAFPQYGLLADERTETLLEKALGSGVEVIGGLDPAGLDRDPVRHLDVVFDLAARHAAAVDIHLHDPGTLGVWELELIAEQTIRTGLSGKVAVSHAYGLGQADEATQARIAEQLAAAGVGVVTAAVYDFPVAPLRKLRAAGVSVACGHDGIRDLWGPYGSGDMLERAMHLAYRSTFRRDTDIELSLEAATYGGAALLGVPTYGLRSGAPADLVVVECSNAAEAVVSRPMRRLVMKDGSVVARNGRLESRIPGSN